MTSGPAAGSGHAEKREKMKHTLRSAVTTTGRRMAGARSLWRANGMREEQFGRPVVGIANSFTQLVPGHVHLHEIGQYVKQRIEACGCFAAEFNTIAVDDGIAMGDKPATKATVVTVDEATCIACHGELSDVAALTADSTALTDDKGTVVNPHERPAGEKHEANPATCTDCHNNHSNDLPKDAMKYCAQCHHRGTFECGTCHELRER